jgi:hypothetical protein
MLCLVFLAVLPAIFYSVAKADDDNDDFICRKYRCVDSSEIGESMCAVCAGVMKFYLTRIAAKVEIV